ncbi:MAG: pyridoxamine 5'-phosphate oxidase family protein [Acidimicrobiia bacterium]
MTDDRLEGLTRAECLEFLGQSTLGRVAVTIGAVPAVLPVNYAMLDGDVVFRSAPGTKLSAAVLGTVVAFEVDEAECVDHSGWSVLVVGHAREIREGPELDAARALPLQAWAGGDRDHFVRIDSKQVTGRRLGSG